MSIFGAKPAVRAWRPAIAADGRRSAMADAIMLVIGIGFFVAAVLYTHACDRM